MGARAGEFPERKTPRRRLSKVHEFADYLRQRWTEGCYNATKLFGEIRKQGYPGRRGMVAQFVSGWRSSKPFPPSPHPRRVSATQVAILATQGPDQLTAEQCVLLKQHRELHQTSGRAQMKLTKAAVACSVEL